MKRKPIRINWDDLESAFDNDREDFVHYLDLVTGQVFLEGEGEEETAEGSEDDVDGPEPLLGEIPARLYIEPASPDHERVWMEDFVRDEDDLDDLARARLKQALDQETGEAFRETLRQIEGARESWFVYRADRLHQLIEQWLEESGVSVSGTPPWK